MSRVAFVAPYLLPTSQRFIRAAASVPGVRLGLITHEPLERVPSELRQHFAGHWRVENALDCRQLVDGARGLAGQLGGLDRLFGVLEHMQVPLARARAELGLPGVDPETAVNFRDKSKMKDLLRAAGLPCARHLLITDPSQASRLVEDAGFPLVVKPPAGAGATSTYRVDDPASLADALRLVRPSPQQPILLEEFVLGDEHSFDSVVIEGEPVWHSLTRYLPTPLEVLRNPWIQWCVLLPREVDHPRYDDIRAAGFAAVRALGLQTGLSHLEWFRRRDGSLAISEVAARPPGAQITTLMAYAHDLDFYQSWARLMIEHRFDVPQRRFAAGAAFLRGMGQGRVRAIHGLDRAQKEVGGLVMEARIPHPGQPAATGYEGEGYVIVRHPDTAVVEAALAAIVTHVRVELAE